MFPVAPTVSVAVIAKLYSPAVIGVPVIAPVAAFKLSPVGKEPNVTAYVFAPVPPVAVTVCEYGIVIVVSGRLAGVTATGGFITTEYALLPVAPTVSVPVIVKLYVPATVAVPLITPVAAFKLSPVGKEPAETENVMAPVPPVEETVWLYNSPSVVGGSVAGEIETGLLITTE